MAKLEFVPAYYEWHLMLNGNILHTWGDFLEDLKCDEYGKSSEEQCCNMADNLMFGWRMESEDNKDIPFIEDDLFVSATETIANEIYRRYGG